MFYVKGMAHPEWITSVSKLCFVSSIYIFSSEQFRHKMEHETNRWDVNVHCTGFIHHHSRTIFRIYHKAMLCSFPHFFFVFDKFAFYFSLNFSFACERVVHICGLAQKKIAHLFSFAF